MKYSLYKQAASIIKSAYEQDARFNHDQKTYEQRLDNVNRLSKPEEELQLGFLPALMEGSSPLFWYLMSQGQNPGNAIGEYGRYIVDYSGNKVRNPVWDSEVFNTLEADSRANEALKAPFQGKAVRKGKVAPFQENSIKWEKAGPTYRGAAGSVAKRIPGWGFNTIWGLNLPHEAIHTWNTLSDPDASAMEKFSDTASTGMSGFAFATEMAKSPLGMKALERVGVDPALAPYWAQYNPTIFKGFVAQALIEIAADEFKNGAEEMTARDKKLLDEANMYAAKNVVDPTMLDNPEAAGKARGSVRNTLEHGSGELATPDSLLAYAAGRQPKKKQITYQVPDFDASVGDWSQTNPYGNMATATPTKMKTITEEVPTDNPGAWGITFMPTGYENYLRWTNIPGTSIPIPYAQGNPQFLQDMSRASANWLNTNFQGAQTEYKKDEYGNFVEDENGNYILKNPLMGQTRYGEIPLPKWKVLGMNPKWIETLPEEEASQWRKPVGQNFLENREKMRALRSEPIHDSNNILGWAGEALLTDPMGAMKKRLKAIGNGLTSPIKSLTSQEHYDLHHDKLAPGQKSTIYGGPMPGEDF